MPFSATPKTVVASRRLGMRIPLDHMEEVVSLYPTNRNAMRAIFEQGMHVVGENNIQLIGGLLLARRRMGGRHDQEATLADIYYFVSAGELSREPRLDGDTYRLANWLFPLITSELAKEINKTVQAIESDEEE